MDVIPVIDLKGGVVVHARMGARDRYRPIETPLARSSAALDVVRGLLSVHPFRTLYIADLDAIAGTGGNRRVVRRLRREWPHLNLWVDSGIADQGSAAAWLDADLGDVVLGSETQTDCLLTGDLAGHPRAVLSLDFRGETFQGPPELLAQPACWPRRVIVMTLSRVGSGTGPDLALLRRMRALAGGHALYAAGGIRDARDLAELAQAGITGALLASSLHDGRLRGRDIEKLPCGQR